MSTFLTTTSNSSETIKKSIQSNKSTLESRREHHEKFTLNKSEEKETKRIQNPYRNIYTNLINLILNFIICKKKIGDLLEKIDPELTGDLLLDFYKYIKDLKSFFCSYFNLKKVEKLIQGNDIPFFNSDFHRVLRIAMKFILE